MMEFTLSRVAMCACAVMLMMAVAGPVDDLFEDRQEEKYARAGAQLSDVMDGFSHGEADSMTLDMALYLPSGTVVSFSGNTMVLETSERSFSYYTPVFMEPSEVLDRCDFVEVTKTPKGLAVNVLAQSPETA